MYINRQDSGKSLLIIFYRNPVQGKVKTRLAATIGDAKALDIYLRLAAHTRSVTENLPVEMAVFYSDRIEKDDIWTSGSYQKHRQSGATLGERMASAFIGGFAAGYSSVCIIGTDCFELTADILQEGFRKLESNDAVIGPAMDGGYYMLGMNSFHPELFQNKSWSTDTVFSDTVADLIALRLRVGQLPALRDIDEEKDLPSGW